VNKTGFPGIILIKIEDVQFSYSDVLPIAPTCPISWEHLENLECEVYV
jgi:hypothetical protein